MDPLNLATVNLCKVIGFSTVEGHTKLRGNLGTIDIAPATLAGHKVSNQSFLSTQSQSHLRKANGVLGIGPQFGSVIRRNSSCDNQSKSIPLMDHIFSQSSGLKSLVDPVITLSLPRMEGNGTFSIMDPELQKRFQKLPKAPVVITPDKINQKWTTRIDGFNLASHSNTSSHNHLVAAYDTGSTYSWVPLSNATSIYAHFNGSYDKKNNLFWVPCTTEVTVNIRIHNQTLSMHPLDTTIDVGEPLCIGTFMPITPAHMTFLDVDVILGMPFFRSFETLINFGNFTHTNSQPPYMQFLQLNKSSTTISEEFRKNREKPRNKVNALMDFEFFEEPPKRFKQNSGDIEKTPKASGVGATLSSVTFLPEAACVVTHVSRLSGVDKELSDSVETGENDEGAHGLSPVTLRLLIAILVLAVFFGSGIVLFIYWKRQRSRKLLEENDPEVKPLV
ncbi:hypothetical protein M422DRAFT_52439 [Sphaerobolus stellatus SS14]|uniref:Peptidase A1 domain-containing protein n=1 Tax=Sphaerobolus stellatus (strain SS14) TaxID=990650 RepID=A0A0C9TSW5_SPHS4|nr:hypothetical protein M422DRAFT_52439 [Sphaerobolus stellatus SS14]